jgi:hypothetical protein
MNGQQARMYRLYFSDEFHRVESWQALHCASDAEAFAEAAALMGDSAAVEIVEGIRIVGTLTATGMAGPRLIRYSRGTARQADERRQDRRPAG